MVFLFLVYGFLYFGKKIPLDTLDAVYLFLLTGNSKLLTYAGLLYTHNSKIGCFQSVGGHSVFVFSPMAQDHSGGGRGA